MAAASPLPRVRDICLVLPEGREVEAWGTPTFRVRNKMFATFASPHNHVGFGRYSLCVKAAPGNQDLLVRADPQRYFVPPYLGPSGWVGIWIDRRPKWTVVREMIHDSYRLVAPKRLLEQLDAR